MAPSNTTHMTNPSTFILMGIPGLETAHGWISIPFCAMYIIEILGHLTILLIVRMEPSLREPMYYFLCMLAASDLTLTTSVLPKMLSIFWFNAREIHFSACLAQIFFINCFYLVGSGIFVAMALDRYVAICHPLRHSTILTNSVVAKIGLAVLLRSSLIVLPYTILAKYWPYCRTNIIPQPYCLHIAVISLACADIRVSSYYSLLITLCVIGLDVLFIVVSYVHVLRAIFKLPTKDARLKTFGTCSSHLCAILAFYIPHVCIVLIARYGHILPLHFHTLFANLFIVMSPTVNPIIYAVRTKRIRDRLVSLFTPKGT